MEKQVEKVMFLCDYQAPYGGNFIPSLMALDIALEQRSVQTVYAFPKQAGQRQWFRELEKRGKTLEVFTKEQSKVGLIKSIQKLIDKHDITVLYTHFISMPTVTALSFLRPRITTVAHIHSDFSAGRTTWKLKAYRCLFYRILAKNIHFISVSEAFEEYNPKRIKWIPNALAVERISCEHIDAKLVREGSGVAEDELLVEIFAWSPFVKGLDIAVNAVKMINETENFTVKLAIVCGRQMVPEKMREWVAAHTCCTGEEAYLIFLTPTEDVYSYHQAADILLSASRSEGFSYAILEMLSLGKRCVISNIPGVTWAKEFESVTAFESENYEACAEAICKAIREIPKQNVKVSDEVLDKYSIAKWTEAVIAQYDLRN